MVEHLDITTDSDVLQEFYAGERKPELQSNLEEQLKTYLGKPLKELDKRILLGIYTNDIKSIEENLKSGGKAQSGFHTEECEIEQDDVVLQPKQNIRQSKDVFNPK